MTTAIDTNVIVALWADDPALSLAAETALETAFRRGNLVVAAPVFAELIPLPAAPRILWAPSWKRMELLWIGT
jgi:hypothetical protein